MKFPIIRVKNKGEKGNGFIVGTNHHHKLILDENGNIKFVNIQCMDATGKYPGYGYEFITKKGLMDEDEEISFGTVWDILNIYAKHIGILDNKELTKEFNDVLKNLENVFTKSNNLNKFKSVESDEIILKYLNDKELEDQIRFMTAIERKRKNDESYYKSIPQISKEIGIEPSDYCDYRAGRKKLPKEIKEKIIKMEE